MSKNLTAKQETDYLKNSDHCPVCNSHRIESTSSWEADSDWVSQSLWCIDCESTWDDVFTLSGIANLIRKT